MTSTIPKEKLTSPLLVQEPVRHVVERGRGADGADRLAIEEVETARLDHLDLLQRAPVRSRTRWSSVARSGRLPNMVPSGSRSL